MQPPNKLDSKQPHPKTLPSLPSSSNQNIYLNPSHKVSFRGIKRLNEHPLAQFDQNAANSIPRTLIKPNIVKSKTGDTNLQKDCHKFSILLESKGYSNSYTNWNCGRNKIDEISFRTLRNMNGSSKYRINTERSQTSKDRLDNQLQNLHGIDQKCREIKNKQFLSSRQIDGQLNSLTKIKNKVISPKKQKNKSQVQVICVQQKIPNIFQHQSIISQHDLVNTSKTNQTIDFDMSPCL